MAKGFFLMLVCKKCSVEKPFEDYYRAKGTKTGYHSSCKDCYKKRVSDYKQQNVQRIREQTRQYYVKNKETILAKNKEYLESNPEVLQKARKNWKKRNPSAVTALTAKRRAARLDATPQWLTEEHYKVIQEYYWIAKDLKAVSGQDYHVDHIVPLQGKNVCGLHVPWNLQILPAYLNTSKGNTHGCSF